MTTLRLAHDLTEILEWRRRVVADVFGCPLTESLIAANAEYLEHTGAYDFYVAEIDGEPVGCGAVCYSREMPSPDNPSGRNGYLMNIFTVPEARGHGVAHAVVEALVGRARSRGCDKIWLETTQAARGVYSDLSFADFPNLMILR